MGLVYVNAIAIVIIFIVLGIHIIYTLYIKINHENKMRIMQDSLYNLETDIEKMKTDLKKHALNGAASILDLAEFSKLDPFAKDLYKNYIVNQIMPAIIESINSDMKTANVEKNYIIYKKDIDAMVAQIVTEIKTNGIYSVVTNMSMGSSPPKQKNNYNDEPLVIMD